MNPWYVKTPPGYSCMFVAPYYNKHKNLEIMKIVTWNEVFDEAIKRVFNVKNEGA